MHNNPNQVLQELRDGNKRFLHNDSAQSSHLSLMKLKDFAKEGQLPKAIVLCCSDSRAPVEMIFDQDIGDLFVIRVAGNIVAPSLVGSIEFAINAFSTNLIIVMGHSQCGAIKATLDHIEDSQNITSENIQDIVSRIKPHILPIAKMSSLSEAEKISQAVKINVQASIEQLSNSSQLIASFVQQGKIQIIGAVLNLLTGVVDFFEIH